MKLASPFAKPDSAGPPVETPVEASPKASRPAPEQAKPAASRAEPAPAASVRPRKRVSLVDRLEQGYPTVTTARLPSVQTVWAYHRSREMLFPVVEGPYAYFAVAWVAFWSLIIWVGTGRYIADLKSAWNGGYRGLVRGQVRPLRDLPLWRMPWTLLFSLVAWCGIKCERLIGTLALLIAIVLPLIWS